MKLYNGWIIYNPLIVKLLSFGFASGITLWPFILINSPASNNAVLLNHERIHIRQQLETLIIGFYLIYVIQFLYYRLRNSRFRAYRMISFEKEAYRYEADLNYLKNRKPFAWIYSNSW